MVSVEFDSMTKMYGDTVGAEDIDITIEDGEFGVLLGPSGCGKTTTLRSLAGLVKPTSGEIRIDGEDVTDTHPKNRDIAMVFQNLALYPHMSVEENIGYPLKVSGVPAEERTKRVEDVAKMLDISELLDRDVGHISGGQAQRVAIGRALIRRPGVFLMDEPLASLDAKLQVEMRNQIKILQRELGITTLYVTHNQEEAQTLGDKLIVMNDGRIEQIGTPKEVYHTPANRFVASFIGSPSMNFLRVRTDGEYISPIDAPDAFTLHAPSLIEITDDRTEFELGVRPQYFNVHTDPIDNAIPATIELTEPNDDDQIITATVDGMGDERNELTIIAPMDYLVGRGDQIWLTIDEDRAHCFDLSSGECLTAPERKELVEPLQ